MAGGRGEGHAQRWLMPCASLALVGNQSGHPCLDPALICSVTQENQARAVRYRQLALAEPDRAKADLLSKLAEEADRGVLCTSDWLSHPSGGPKPPRQVY
jgi:hypothetical protein